MAKIADYFKRSWLCLLFMLVGIGLLVGYFTEGKDRAGRCTEPVTATITDYQESLVTDDRGDTVYEYRLSIQYQVAGETYSYGETTKTQPNIGDPYELVYNPADPGEAMTPASAKTAWLTPILGGAMALFFGWLSIPGRKRKTAPGGPEA